MSRSMMKLELVLPPPLDDIASPVACPRPTCAGSAVRLHQRATRRPKDIVPCPVIVERYRCLGCGRTFRKYPAGVTRAHTAACVHRLAVVLHQLGLSYGAVATVLEAFGVYMSRTSVFRAIQQAQLTTPRLVRVPILGAARPHTGHARTVFVRCGATWLRLTVRPADSPQLVLALSPLPAASAVVLADRIAPVADALGWRVEVVADAAPDGAGTITDA